LDIVFLLSGSANTPATRVAQKSKPLPNYQKKLLNRIKVCPWDQISS